MEDIITLNEPGLHGVLAAHPVNRENYRRYLRETGQPAPPVFARPEPPTNPVTYISQVDALAYCRWLSTQQGHAYRLPTMAELQELARETADEGISPDFWPHTHGQLSELRGGSSRSSCASGPWRPKSSSSRGAGRRASWAPSSTRPGCGRDPTPPTPRPASSRRRGIRSSRSGWHTTHNRGRRYDDRILTA